VHVVIGASDNRGHYQPITGSSSASARAGMPTEANEAPLRRQLPAIVDLEPVVVPQESVTPISLIGSA